MEPNTWIEVKTKEMHDTFFLASGVYNDSSFGEHTTSAYFCGCVEGDLSGELDRALPKFCEYFRTALQEAQKQERERIVTAMKKHAENRKMATRLDGTKESISLIGLVENLENYL